MNGPIYMLSFFPTSYTKENIQNYTAHHKNNMLCMTILYTQYAIHTTRLRACYTFMLTDVFYTELIQHLCVLLFFFSSLPHFVSRLYSSILAYFSLRIFLLKYYWSPFIPPSLFLIFSHGAIHRHHHH